MKSNPNVLRSFLVFTLLFLPTILFTPWWTTDSFNIPKLLVISCIGFALFIGILPGIRGHITRIQLAAISLFTFAVVLSWAYGSHSILDQWFGDYGRSTGVQFYLTLIAIITSFIVIAEKAVGETVLWSLVASWLVNVGYGLLQLFGSDPIKWENAYSPVFGTFGNPDFYSAFLGMGLVASSALLLKPRRKWYLVITILVSSAASLLLIYKTSSVQGFLVIGIGGIVVIYLRFFRSGKSGLRLTFFSAIAITGMLGILGILDKGPLGHYLHESSVSSRGDYWRAGLRMFFQHPLTGVGLDSYGDWYRASRDLEAAQRFSAGVVTNAAHNVFIDIAASGGALLLVGYLMIIAMIILSSLRLTRKEMHFDHVHAALIAVFFGYLAQSAVSINQVALGLWGWALGGVIVGLENRQSRADTEHTSSHSSGFAIRAALGSLIGFILIAPIFIKDAKYLEALKAGDAIKIERVARSWPQTSYYLQFSSGIFADNKLYSPALSLAQAATKLNGRDYEAWDLIFQNKSSSQSQKSEALRHMRDLDPYNMEIRK